jgi:hypothetical protein
VPDDARASAARALSHEGERHARDRHPDRIPESRLHEEMKR